MFIHGIIIVVLPYHLSFGQDVPDHTLSLDDFASVFLSECWKMIQQNLLIYHIYDSTHFTFQVLSRHLLSRLLKLEFQRTDRVHGWNSSVHRILTHKRMFKRFLKSYSF